MDDGSTGAESIGRRISRKRRAGGLTQQGLADRAYVSRSLIQQVETGRKTATPSLVAAVAQALGADPAELYGQPYRRGTAHADRVHAAISDIRRALACSDVPAELDVPPRTLDVLASEITRLVELSKATKHIQIGASLPAVLDELAVHAHQSDSPRAWRLLNRAQAVAVSLTRRLGYNDLASVGVERAAASAARSDDPNLPRLAKLSRSLLLMAIGAWEPGLRLVQRASEGMEQDTAASQAVYGALQLRASVLCARAGNASDAWEHHGLASEVARRMPPRQPDYYGLQFNPANIGIHGVAAAVELADFDEAIRRDHDFRSAPGLSAERRAHHEIDMSRALVSTAQWDLALRRMVRADRIAPQMTRYHPMAREAVGHLVDHYRALPEPLRALQGHMGLA